MQNRLTPRSSSRSYVIIASRVDVNLCCKLTKPDILILGQITIDHVVPAAPGAWVERLGGNALYAAAGARLWCDPRRIGIVARRGPNLPATIETLLQISGLTTAGLVPTEVENMLEWLIYETDGSRRNLPRAPDLRDTTVDAATRDARYIARKYAISASHTDIPAAWLPAGGIHLAPQVGDRHPASVKALADRAALLSVDPSPTYSRGMDVSALGSLFRDADVFVPSQGECEHLAPGGDWPALTCALQAAGIGEIVIKLGAQGVVGRMAGGERFAVPAAPANPVDFTGAGDAFCGAYLACRVQGFEPEQAARRAVIAAAMVIECAGADAALGLSSLVAGERLAGAAA